LPILSKNDEVTHETTNEPFKINQLENLFRDPPHMGCSLIFREELVEEEIMWTCCKCNEELEDQFDSCWKCGTGKDGVTPVFSKRSDQTSSRAPQPNSTSLEAEIQEKFRCCKCEHREAIVKRISTTGSGFSKLIDLQHNTFIAVSCENCGYTEFFNPDVLGGKKYFGTIMDLIFGG
jgi:predicted nucleic-acid-binding Zn-ribbon protein